MSNLCKNKPFYLEKFNVLYKDVNILFGAGSTGISYLKELSSVGIRIDYFCDSDEKKWGNIIHNIKVISVEQLIDMSKNQVINIIISSVFEDDIFEQLKKEKLNARIYRELNYDLKHIREMQKLTESEMDIWLENIKKVQNYLYDDKSKHILENLKNYMITYDTKFFNKVDYGEDKQYFIKEIIDFISDTNILDCGAFIGDTIENMLKDLNIEVKHIYAFEAAEENYNKLIRTIDSLGINDLVTPINKGVWNRNEHLFMSNSSGSDSKVTSEEYATSVELITIDDYFKYGPEIGFIKMDIEGSELNALQGAINVIKRDRPLLAICIYHSIMDYVLIPMYLKSVLNDYNFIIRHHHHRLSETVLYCIPKEKELKVRN